MNKQGKFLKKNSVTSICIALCVAAAIVSSAQLSINTQASQIQTREQPIFTVATLENLQAALSHNIEENILPVPEPSYALFVDGKKLAVTAEESEITDVLDKIKAEALSSYSDKNAKAEITQKTEIKKDFYDETPVTSDELYKILNKPVENEVLYTIEDGDAPYSICEKYGLSLEEFSAMNGDNYDDYMFTGRKVKVKEETKLLTVTVTVTKTYTKAVKFKTETTYDDNDYADNKTVTQEGKNGKTQYTDEISYIDGKQVKVKNISKKVISKPVTEKVTVGTIEHHYGHSTGNFLWPLPGYSMITSPFGPRWGTNHNGIDIAGSGIYGADIIASDGGMVTLAQSDDSGYGMHIIIDHGNGFETQYAHCSELYVSAGEEVYAGQVIAAVGSTGYSTGPHLHFEIIDNGTKVDPQIYLG